MHATQARATGWARVHYTTPHQSIHHVKAYLAAVPVELRGGGQAALGIGMTPAGHLPGYAQRCLERLDRDSDLRTASGLDWLLAQEADKDGELVELNTCASAHHISSRRWGDFQPQADMGREQAKEWFIERLESLFNIARAMKADETFQERIGEPLSSEYVSLVVRLNLEINFVRRSLKSGFAWEHPTAPKNSMI